MNVLKPEKSPTSVHWPHQNINHAEKLTTVVDASIKPHKYIYL